MDTAEITITVASIQLTEIAGRMTQAYAEWRKWQTSANARTELYNYDFSRQTEECGLTTAYAETLRILTRRCWMSGMQSLTNSGNNEFDPVEVRDQLVNLFESGELPYFTPFVDDLG